MIPDAIFGILDFILGGMFDLLPTFTINFDTMGFAYDFGTKFAAVETFLPVLVTLAILYAIVQYWLPAVIVYKFANWIYKHIPQIGGFGPGSG